MRALAGPLLILLFASPARAEDAERAAERFEAAERAFEKRDFVTAAKAFEEAAELKPHPAAWLNAAEAWERAGEPALAAQNCERARALSEDDPLVNAEIDQRLDRLSPRLGRLRLRSNEALVASVDNEEFRAVPADRWVTPGRHVVEVSDVENTRRNKQEVRVAAGESKTLDLTLDVHPEPEPTPLTEFAVDQPSEEPYRGPPALSWICFGVGGAATLTGIVLGGLTLQAQSTYDASPSPENAEVFFDRRRGTNVSWVIAAVAVGAGIAFWFVDGGE